MARIGVNYETVKHTAIKLLSQGESPSVQKIREVLGTGSNTTIAQYLKVWREEHKNKEIHHLPANMPKELIAAIEVLWQAAMEQAQNQLVVIKQDLDQRSEEMQQEKLTLETSFNEIKNRLAQALQKLDDKNHEIQVLNTELAVAQEKLANGAEESTTTKNQYELRLNHITEEKYAAVSNSELLRKELAQLQQQLSNQAEKHQAIMVEERTRQEQSEKRWLNLIDQSRVDAKSAQKNYETTVNKQNKQIEVMQTSIVDYKHKIMTQQSELENCKAIIADLKTQMTKSKKQSHAATTVNSFKNTQEKKNKGKLSKAT